MFPHECRGRVERVAGRDLGAADPPEDATDRSEHPDSHRELVPTVVEHEHPATVARLFELPFHARRHHVPPAAPRVHDLHVQADRCADLAGVDDLAQLHERGVEDVVLEDAEHHSVAPRRVDDPGAVFEAARDRLLQLHGASRVEHPDRDVGVSRSGNEHVDDIGIDRQQPVEVAREERVGDVRSPPFEARPFAVAQRDDLDLGVRQVGRQRELGDLTRTDDGDPDGPTGDRRGTRRCGGVAGRDQLALLARFIRRDVRRDA